MTNFGTTEETRTKTFINSKGNVICEFKEVDLKPLTSEEQIRKDIEEGKKILEKKIGHKKLEYLLEISKESLKHKLWKI